MLPLFEHSLLVMQETHVSRNLILGRKRPISCSTNMVKDPNISLGIQLANAKVIHNIALATTDINY